jgi:arylsulfatase A-like enzyme
VLLVSIDTLRADRLSAWGHTRTTSPRIDELCAEGVRCAEAVSTTSWTMPAHLSMLTGLSVSAHGMCDDRLLDLAAQGDAELPLRGTFLAELLKRRGYETGGFYTWIYLEPRFGFDAGFDHYERVGHSAYSHPEWRVRFEDLRARVVAGDEAARAEFEAWRQERPEIFDEQRPTSGEAVTEAISWLDARDGEAPWFLFVHLFDVHDDYVPPPPFDTMFDPEYEGPIDGRRVTSPDSPVRGDMDPRDLEHLKALYDGEIAWVDSQVGRLLDHLDVLDVADDTLVVLTSDHGEEFYEHGNKTHRHSLYQESVLVPLVFRLPGRLPEGRVVEGPTGIVDVVPTVCELLDVPAPPVLSGRSLASVLTGEQENGHSPYVSLLFDFPEAGGAPTRHVGVHRGTTHSIFVRRPGGAGTRVEYDLASDPRELRPGATDAIEDPDLYAALEELRSAAAAARAAALPRSIDVVALSDADLAELAAMGYARGEARGGDATGDDVLCLDGCVWPSE